MTMLPANLARVPNILSSRITLQNISRTNVELLTTQSQIATGRDILRPSDDIVRAAGIATLDDRLERSTQLSRNLSNATSSLNLLDDIFNESTDVAQQAKSIAASQLNFTSSATERAGQSIVVDQLLQSLFNTANRSSVSGFLLGGSRTDNQPVEEFAGAYRYVGQGTGITTDLGLASSVPITMGNGNPVTARSARLHGNVDFNPRLVSDARLVDIAGARGLGVTLGTVEFSFNGGPRTAVDLTGSDTLQDVTAKLTRAIKQYETDNSVTVLGPGGVSVGTTSAGALSIDVAPGAGPSPASVQFFDVGSGVTAQDLGLVPPAGSGAPAVVFSSTSAAGNDINPKLSWRSKVSDLTGVTGPLGSIRLNNAGRYAVVDLSSAQTLGDIKNLIETANLGARVQINDQGTGIDVLNDVSTDSASSMSIEEVPGSNLTATRLGIRSLDANTSLSDFNYGRGVQVINGMKNPTTGLPDPTLDVDFQITLGDAAGTVLNIDLRPQDVATVQTLMNRINSVVGPQLTAAGLSTSDFAVGLTNGANGLALQQSSAFTNPIQIKALNNSPAAEQLGLTGGTYDATTHTLLAQDTAKVRVDSLFTHLSDLKAALARNDTRGIQLAGEDIEKSIGRLAETRGLIGGLAKRVDEASTREEDRRTLDEQMRSDLRDTDFTKAASKFTLLQTQLEAGLRVASSTQQLSLLNFLG